MSTLDIELILRKTESLKVQFTIHVNVAGFVLSTVKLEIVKSFKVGIKESNHD